MTFEDFKKEYEYKKVEKYPNEVFQKPLVSVCVQTYQHVAYIKECLEGILMQKTDFPFEILLGEDDSSDGTREICIEYAQKHPDKIQLFLHHRENNIKINETPSGRFNLLYNLFSVRGRYIAFCEGDDYWTDHFKLQKQFNYLENNNDCSWCSHDVYSKFNDERLSNVDVLKEKVLYGYKFDSKITVKAILPTRTVSMFLKTSVLSSIPDWSILCPAGDSLLKLLCAKDGKMGYLPEVMAVYRRMSSNSWSVIKRDLNWYKHAYEEDKNLLNHYNVYTNFKFDKIIKRRIERDLKYFILFSQDFQSKSESFQLIADNIEIIFKTDVLLGSRIFLRFLLGKKLYTNFFNLTKKLKG